MYNSLLSCGADGVMSMGMSTMLDLIPPLSTITVVNSAINSTTTSDSQSSDSSCSRSNKRIG